MPRGPLSKRPRRQLESQRNKMQKMAITRHLEYKLYIRAAGWALIMAACGLAPGLSQSPNAVSADEVAVPARTGSTQWRLVSQPPMNGQERPTLPPVVVEPHESSGGYSPDSSSYPRMQDLRFGRMHDGFGGATGIMRSDTSVFDSPAAVSVTRRNEILEKQASNMFSALQHEVGVMLQSTAAGQASPFVRGLTGQQVLILIDGIRLNNSIFRFGPNQYFNTIDPAAVEQLEVVRGQGAVLWGSDAIGGAINIVTRSPDIHRGTYHEDYRGGAFTEYYNTADSSSYSRLSVEGWTDDMGVFAGGSFLNTRDLDTGFDVMGRQPGTNYQQWAGDIKFNYLVSNHELLTIGLQHFQQDDLPRSDRYPGFPGDRNNSNTFEKARFFDPQQRDLSYVRYQSLEVAGLDTIMLTGSYHRQRENQRRGVPEVRFQETDVKTFGINAVAVKDYCQQGKITTGVDWYYDNVDSRFGGTASGPIIPDDAWYSRFGAFLNWEMQWTPRLSGVAGVRYEAIQLAATPIIDGTPISIAPSYNDWVGQVGLTYAWSEEVRLVGSISEGFRAPNLDELTANNPNVLQEGEDLPSLGLLPEQSVTYEVGIKTDFDRLRTQTFVFWTDLDGNIVPVSAGANQFRRANQDSYIQGIEFSGELLLDDGWSLYGNFWYTYGRNRMTAAPLSRVPPAQGIAGVRWRCPSPDAYFAVYVWLVDRQDRLDPVRDLGDERIPIGGTSGFATLNFRTGRTYGDHDQHRVSLSVENFTDQPYLVHGSGVLGTGITARLGYQWQY